MPSAVDIFNKESFENRQFIWNYVRSYVRKKLDFVEDSNTMPVAEVKLKDGSYLKFTTRYSYRIRGGSWNWQEDTTVVSLYSHWYYNEAAFDKYNYHYVIEALCELDQFAYVNKWITTGKYKEAKKNKKASAKRQATKKKQKKAEVFNCANYTTIARSVLTMIWNDALESVDFHIPRFRVYASRGSVGAQDMIKSKNPKYNFLMKMAQSCSKAENDITGKKLAEAIHKIDPALWERLATISCPEARRLYVAFTEDGEAIGAFDKDEKVRMLANKKLGTDE